MIDINEMPIHLTKEEADAIIAIYEHHLEFVMPAWGKLLGIDVRGMDCYREFMRSKESEE